MKKNVKKILAGASSFAMLSAGAMASVAETNYSVETAETISYDEVKNVQGSFRFNQDDMTPTDDMFSLFGTAATALCAKPAFAMDEAAAPAEYYFNVAGKLKMSYSTTLQAMQEKGGVKRIMVCSCATGSALAQTSVTGVLVSDMLEVAGLLDDANAIAFKSADGYTATLPLNYVLEKKAMLAWQIGDAVNPSGLQVWMPSTVAKYFTRQVVEMEVFHSDEAIAVDGLEAEQRAKVSILNHDSKIRAVGDELVFSGYADDCGTAIAAVEFSMDGGKTWTTCETAGARADRWVAWEFGYTAAQAGTFKLDVRAVTADGTVSPLASSVTFTVE